MKKRVLSLFLAFALCLTLLPTSVFAEGADGSAAAGAQTEDNGQPANTGEGEQPNSETDTRTEIWCVMKPSSIQRSYDGTTDGSTIPIDLTFTDGTNEIKLKERTGFTAKKTFDSADAGWHTVTVEIELIGDAAAKYKLKAGGETFTIGGYIDKAHPDLTVSLSKAACTVGEKLLPLLSISGVQEDATVTYYYTQYKTIAGSSEYEGSESMPKIDENTAISEPGTYYVYAKTGKTKNYEEGRSTTAELTVNEAVVEAASVTKADGTVSGTYKTLPAALNAAQNGDTVKLLANHTTNWSNVEAGDEQMAVVRTRITLDLNGNTVDYLVVGEVVPDEEGGIVDSYDGNLTVVDNIQGGSHGKIKDLEFVKGSLAIQGGQIGDSDGGLTCNVNSGNATISGGTVLGLEVSEGATVTVNSGSAHAGAWLNDGTLTITGGTFDSVWFRNNGGTIAIRGGTFGEITNENASGKIPVMSLLADGYAFYGKDADEKYTVLQDSRETTLENVKVMDHTDHAFLNGACIACGALTCDKSNNGEEGGCIAHAVWSPWADNPTWGTTHIKTLDELRKKITDGGTSWSEMNPDAANATVTFLSDVTVDETFLINQYFAQIFLDLNGHTLSGELQEPIITANFSAGNPIIAIRNGTIENTGTGEAIRLESGRVTLENVNVTGDMAIAYQYVNGSMYTAPFLGGGSFTRICPAANDVGGTWSKELKDMLGTGCCFLDSAGSRIDAEQWFGSDAYSKIKELIDVRVKACDHKDENGSYTLFEDATMSYGSLAKRCKICGNLCPHDEITGDQNPACVACGLPIVIKTTNLLGGKDIGPWYYTGLNDAMHEILHVHKGRRPTLELLADTESDSSYEWLTNDYEGITIDLAGHTLTLTGDQNKASYWVTIQNTSNTHAEVRGTVNVYHKDAKSRLVILNTDNDLTIEKVKFVDGGTAELAGGSFGKITVPAGKLLASLLVSGYYFADSTSGKPAALYDANGNALTELTNVTVKACSHDEAIYIPADGGAWKCFCGQKTFVASITKDEATTYYTDLQEAFRAADGGTVKLMANVGDVTVNTDTPFILDLNGFEVYSLTVNSKITLKDSSGGTGKIAENLIVAADGLTVGDLLEEGYAFRYVSTGNWCEDTWQTVGGVSVHPVPIKSVTAVNPTVTVQYGETETLTATVVPSAEEDEAVSCQWYRIGGTETPVEGATGSTYQLPADLTGTCPYRLTATKDGYRKSCDFTVTVTPVSLEGATVVVGDLTYNGKKQTPEVTVKLGEKVLKKDKDYTLTDAEQTNAGSYKLTITGKGGYNGAIENVDWKIEPMQLYRFCDIEPVTKVYDGTAVAPIAKSALAFHDANARGASVTLPEDAYDITNARFTMRQGDGTYVESPEAGNGKSLSFTVTLTSDNYVFESTTEDSKTIVCDIATDAEDKFTITKAAAPTNIPSGTLNIINGTHQTYTYDFSKLLPELSEGQYGTISYGNQPAISLVSQSGYYYDKTIVEFHNGVLTLAQFYAKDGTMTGQIGTVKVKVTTTNYEDFQLTLVLNAINKIKPTPDGKITASKITYGQALSDSSITGKMKDPNTSAEVEGTFSWQQSGDTILDASTLGHSVEWTFTPTDENTYTEATGTATVEVGKAQQYGEISMAGYSYGGTPSTPTLTKRTGDPNAQVIYEYSAAGNGSVQAWDIQNPPALNAGTYRMFARIGETSNYYEYNAKSCEFVVAKATPTYTKPTGLTAKYGQTLADVTLPDGWSWMESSESVGGASTAAKTFKAKFTPTDTDNYNVAENIELDVTVNKADQAALTIQGADSVLYGQTLTLTASGGSGTGAVTYRIDTDHSTGEATIDPNTGVLTPVKVGSVSVIATRAGDSNYNDVTSAPFVLMVKPVAPTGAPKYTKITTGGKTLKDAALTTDGSTLKPNVGNLEWVDDEGSVLSNDTTVDANKTYKWRFTPTDVNYTVLTGSIELYHRSSGGGGSYTPSYTVSVDKTENGTITVSPKSAYKGDTVTITVKPDKGYELDTIKVLDQNGDKVKLTEKDGKYTFKMPDSKVEIQATFVKEAEISPFGDVSTDAYYYEAVKWAQKKGITGGIGNDLFGPNQPCIRAQIATFLWRAAGSPEPKNMSSFSDVPTDSYYAKAVAWAVENGITAGTGDGKFSPNATCTRAQSVTFLYRASGSPAVSDSAVFGDVAANAFYADAVAWAVANGVTNGTTSSTFSPDNGCPRAQIVTFLYRAFNK